MWGAVRSRALVGKEATDVPQQHWVSAVPPQMRADWCLLWALCIVILFHNYPLNVSDVAVVRAVPHCSNALLLPS